MANTFHLSVITPERAVLDTEATFAAVPAHDGEIGILVNRAPMLYRLGAGLLRADTDQGKTALFVAGGFVQMVENRLTVLTETAKDMAHIDRASAEKALADAEALPGVTDPEFQYRQRMLASARAQIRLSQKV